MQTIFAKLLYEMEKQHDTVLVTVVRESGSAPRGTGAQMLVNIDGLQAGSIGGGNVENLSILYAKELIAKKQSDIRDFELHRSDKEDTGMVCGGDITTLFTYIPGIDERWCRLASKLLQHITEYRGGYLALPLSGDCGYLADSQAENNVFTLPVATGERAIIFGAGHCALALAPILRSVGFRVTVFDDRADLVTSERFPMAEKLICGNFEHIAEHIILEPNDYIVIMTSGHTYDFVVQEQILRHPAAYVGVIGSRSKTASVNTRLRAAGVDEVAISTVHTPIGTAIKAVTPEEIAISIAGEMIYERALRRERAGIHVHGCPMH